MKKTIIVTQKRSVEKLRRLSNTPVEVFKNQLGYVVTGTWIPRDVDGYKAVPEEESEKLRKMDAAL